MKNIILLSEKSSGSSAFQNLLTKLTKVNSVEKTRHFQNETLYWTKAASILKRPQIKMVDSEVPIESQKARKDLVTMLQNNLKNYQLPKRDKDIIFDGWELLCEKYSPIFIEKSPHHLCQWSSIELILECIERKKNIDFLIVGLVRNPMDTIYSQYRNWKSNPKLVEAQWIIAYSNLLKLKKILKEKLFIVKYEEMVASVDNLNPILNFCKVNTELIDNNYLHQKALQKWKKDKFYGFKLSKEGCELAKKYGYLKEDLRNNTNILWPLIKTVSRINYLTYAPVKRQILKFKNALTAKN